MSAFEKFKARQIQKQIDSWPEWAPPFLRHLTKDQMRRAMQESELMDPMPDAELTPELVELRNIQREATQKSFEAFVKSGQILLELKRRFPNEAEFWDHVENVWKFRGGRENATLAMEAATEQN